MRGEKFSFPDLFANNPILAAICVLFLLADIVLLDHIISDRIHQKEIRQNEYKIEKLQNSNNELNDKYNKINDMYSHIDAMYKELELRNHETQLKVDSKISSLTANLNTCQDSNLKFITKFKEQDSEAASLKNDLHDHAERLNALKKLFAQQLVLEPTWIRAGEVSRALSDDVTLTIDEASDKSLCPKDSPAVVHFVSGSGKKDLCLNMDQPQTFTYNGKKFFLHLLGIKGDEPPHGYLVAIVKEREKRGGEATPTHPPPLPPP
jgi:predicted RNase H-like nuclease (RuvC/YqgF family)